VRETRLTGQAQFFNTQLFGTDFSGLYAAAREEVFGRSHLAVAILFMADIVSAASSRNVQALITDIHPMHPYDI